MKNKYFRYIEIVFYRAAAELRRDAARAYLGVLWWFIEPILYMSVFYLVFGIGLRRGGEDFVMYLLTGLIVWKWFDGSVRSASGVILSSVGLMQQVYLPKILLPAVVVVMNSYKFAIIMSLFLIFLGGFWSGGANEHWLALPLLILLQLFLICCFAGLASALVPVIPDLKHLVDYGMTLLFFMSGIFFDFHDLTPKIQDILSYNPILVVINSYRDVLLYDQWPNWIALRNVTLCASVFFVGMLFLHVKLDRYYPRVVG